MHSRFETQSKRGSWEMFTDRHPVVFYISVATQIGVYGPHHLAKKYEV